MELRHLRYALAVADEGSFTRAASVLRVAQQALSHQVADLERELGVKLFDRLPRGVRATPAGAGFLLEARQILAESAHAVNEARRVARAGVTSVRVGFPMVTAPAIGELLARLRRAHPAVVVEADQLLSREQGPALQQGRIDVALDFSPPDDDPTISGEVVAEPPFACAILPAGHPLAGREAVYFEELATSPMLLPDPDVDPYLSARLAEAFAARGMEVAASTFRLHGTPSPSLVAVSGDWLLWFDGAETAPGTVSCRILDPPLTAPVWLLSRRGDPSPVVRLVRQTMAVGGAGLTGPRAPRPGGGRALGRRRGSAPRPAAAASRSSSS
jgi:DNA-binding transcriptional LysR family regulator